MVAVHRYLRHRLASHDYERDFGGVYYLFLRGMNARRGADYGIFAGGRNGSWRKRWTITSPMAGSPPKGELELLRAGSSGQG